LHDLDALPLSPVPFANWAAMSLAMTLRSLRLNVLLGMLLLSGCGAATRPRTFDVRDFGAKGDRTTLDTTAHGRPCAVEGRLCIAAG